MCARPNYGLGDSATLDNHNFEVQGFCYGSGYGPGYRRGVMPIRRWSSTTF